MVTDAGQRADLAEWLTHKVRPMFEQRTLPVSADVMLKWRLMVERGRKSGYTFSQPDLIIAASAAYYGLTAVTRDISEFERARVSFLNPWNASLRPS